MQRFLGKTVVITGAGRGIGATCAERFVAEGAQGILVARNNQELQVLANTLGPAAKTAPCDVTDAAWLAQSGTRARGAAGAALGALPR